MYRLCIIFEFEKDLVEEQQLEGIDLFGRGWFFSFLTNSRVWVIRVGFYADFYDYFLLQDRTWVEVACLELGDKT